MKMYPGGDGCVRVIDVLIKVKVFRRPSHHLVYLPIEEDRFTQMLKSLPVMPMHLHYFY